MESFKTHFLSEGKVTIANLKAGMKLNVIHQGRSAKQFGIKDENVYGGKVQVLGIGIIPWKKEAKSNMVLAKDIKDLKKKYEKIFKSEEIQSVSYTHLTLPTTPYV